MNKQIKTKSYTNEVNLWFIIFATLNLVFICYQASFMIGNHDWDWVKGTTQILRIDTGLFEGRYAKFILNSLLFNGQILPILNSLVAFSLLALGGVLLCAYWKLPKNDVRVLISLVFCLAPYVLGWLYFSINIIGNFVAIPLVLFGLIKAEKRNNQDTIIAIICFLLALGIYPSVMETMFVCWCFRYLLIPTKTIKERVPSVLVILGAIALFKLVLTSLTKFGFIYTEHYNLKTVGISELFFRLPEMLKLSFNQLWITIPFCPSILKIVGLLIVCSAIAVSVFCKYAIIFWLGAIFSTVLSAMLAHIYTDVAYMPRINFYGLNFLYTGALAIILTAKIKMWRNLGFVFGVVYLLLSINQDFYAQKTWLLGRQAEEKLVERISTRIESKAKDLPLIPVIAGELPLRPRYYYQDYDKVSPYVLNNAYVVRHIPSGMYNFYAPIPLFYEYSQISDMSSELYNFLQTSTLPWPSEQGVYVDNKYAVILLTNEGIKAIQAQLPK